MAERWSYSLAFRGERHELEERTLTVGRSRACDVSIKDPSVSRRHAELTPGGGEISVRVAIREREELPDGARITDGDFSSGALGANAYWLFGDVDASWRPFVGAGVVIGATCTGSIRWIWRVASSS